MGRSYNMDRYPDADYTPNDMGPGEGTGLCPECRWPWNQFNHTPENCAKRKQEDKVIKEDEIKNDTI